MMGIPNFDLFAIWRTSTTYSVRVALNLRGIMANERLINIDAGEQLSQEFLKINPLGAIPALLQAGQQPLTQSIAILEFLGELQPELLPKNLYGRARVRSIAAMLSTQPHPSLLGVLKKYVISIAKFDGLLKWPL